MFSWRRVWRKSKRWGTREREKEREGRSSKEEVEQRRKNPSRNFRDREKTTRSLPVSLSLSLSSSIFLSSSLLLLVALQRAAPIAVDPSIDDGKETEKQTKTHSIIRSMAIATTTTTPSHKKNSSLSFPSYRLRELPGRGDVGLELGRGRLGVDLADGGSSRGRGVGGDGGGGRH